MNREFSTISTAALVAEITIPAREKRFRGYVLA
jgi:hypothetical protein